MQVKSYREQLQEIARTFARTHSKEYELDDVVLWAIETHQWSLSSQATHKIARKQFADALRLAKDGDGCRVFIDARMQQRRLWADRRDASWALRQTFLDEQLRRLKDFRSALVSMWETLNSERRPGESQFTLVFDDKEEA